MRVAVISAEAVPYSKTGGLGDVAGALPKALKKIGVDSLLITPCYWQTKGEYLWHTAIDDLDVEWRGAIYPAKAFYSEANGSPTFLIDRRRFFTEIRSTVTQKITNDLHFFAVPLLRL